MLTAKSVSRFANCQNRNGWERKSSWREDSFVQNCMLVSMELSLSFSLCRTHTVPTPGVSLLLSLYDLVKIQIEETRT